MEPRSWHNAYNVGQEFVWRYFYVCILIMDWIYWSLQPPPIGSTRPAISQDTLALTTALGYSLLACETCMLNCCFDPVSIPAGRMALLARSLSDHAAVKCFSKYFLSDVVGLRSPAGGHD